MPAIRPRILPQMRIDDTNGYLRVSRFKRIRADDGAQDVSWDAVVISRMNVVWGEDLGELKRTQ